MEHVTPPTTDGLLSEILAHFGLTEPQDVHSWPYLEDHRRSINRLVAKFTCAGQRYLLKARTVEHRGTKALFETQNIHKALHQRGVPVPALHSAPNGETLIPGPNPRDETGAHYEVLCFLVGPEFFHVPQVYYEIQYFIPGRAPSADKQAAYQIGAVLAEFHAAGHQPTIRSLTPEEWGRTVPHIDTYLLSKGLYINDFITRGATRRRRLHDAISALKTISPEEQRQVSDLFCRLGDFSRLGHLSWSITHGNFSLNNVLVGDKGACIIDLDEAGLGPISNDVGEMLVDLEHIEPQRALIKGYIENGGHLSDLDRTDIVDGMVYQKIATTEFNNGHQELKVSRFFEEGWAVF